MKKKELWCKVQSDPQSMFNSTLGSLPPQQKRNISVRFELFTLCWFVTCNGCHKWRHTNTPHIFDDTKCTIYNVEYIGHWAAQPDSAKNKIKYICANSKNNPIHLCETKYQIRFPWNCHQQRLKCSDLRRAEQRFNSVIFTLISTCHCGWPIFRPFFETHAHAHIFNGNANEKMSKTIRPHIENVNILALTNCFSVKLVALTYHSFSSDNKYDSLFEELLRLRNYHHRYNILNEIRSTNWRERKKVMIFVLIAILFSHEVWNDKWLCLDFNSV